VQHRDLLRLRHMWELLLSWRERAWEAVQRRAQTYGSIHHRGINGTGCRLLARLATQPDVYLAVGQALGCPQPAQIGRQHFEQLRSREPRHAGATRQTPRPGSPCAMT